MNPEGSDLYLDNYESEGKTVWCWKRGVYSSPEFATQEDAVEAMENEEVELTRADGRDVLDEIIARRGVEPPFDYWIVDDSFVVEPSVSGMQLGELPDYEVPSGAKVLEMTQEEFEELVADFYMREGAYPDT